jgi:hypothetical protein
MLQKKEILMKVTAVDEKCKECPYMSLERIMDLTGKHRGGVHQECRYADSCIWASDHMTDD